MSALCVHVAVAGTLVQAGLAVVLFGPDSAALGDAARRLRTAGRGRVAVFVGDPADEGDRDAAIAMATEQFGAVPVIVRSQEEALSLVRGFLQET
jgi:ABC-type sugar transport system substrate-binding protein